VLRQRSHRELTPQKLLSEVFWSPLDWPSKTIRLEKNGAYEVRHRSLSGAISPAELYHENSKLTASTLQSYTASEINPDEVKIEFARRRSAIAKKTTTVPLNLAAPFRKLLTDVAKTTWPQLFYSIELRVVAAALAAIHEPLSDTLSVVKRLSAGDVERMHRAIRLTAPPKLPPHTGPHLFVVANFPRNEVLLGQRGYRQTLLEAGQIAQSIVSAAAPLRIETWPISDFDDRELDSALEIDGVEDSTLIAFELKGTA